MTIQLLTVWYFLGFYIIIIIFIITFSWPPKPTGEAEAHPAQGQARHEAGGEVDLWSGQEV